jgi:hypothetical protein
MQTLANRIFHDVFRLGDAFHVPNLRDGRRTWIDGRFALHRHFPIRGLLRVDRVRFHRYY